MSELLSSVIGGSGSFLSTFASGTISISPGTTGDITITPPLGERVMLTGISSPSATQTSLTTIAVGGVNIATGVLIAQPGSSVSGENRLSIGFSDPSQKDITGDVNQALVISTNIARSHSTIYTYQFGV